MPAGFKDLQHPTAPVINEPSWRYEVVEHKDAARLAARIARPEPYKDLIFTTWQGGGVYKVFTRFWWSHIRAVGLEDHALMITYSREHCTGLPVNNCVVHKVEDMLRIMGERRIPRDNGGWKPGGSLAVVSKWTWSLEFVKAGYNVIFSDSDAAFVQNPFDWWWRPPFDKIDIMGLSDWRPWGGEVGRETPDYCNRRIHDICQSTGIMFFRGNERVLASLQDQVRAATPHGRIWEQQLWNRFIPRKRGGRTVHNGTYSLLPTKSFMNQDWVRGQNPDAVAVHMGYVDGACNKLQKHYCFGTGVVGLEPDAERVCPGATRR